MSSSKALLKKLQAMTGTMPEGVPGTRAVTALTEDEVQYVSGGSGSSSGGGSGIISGGSSQRTVRRAAHKA